MVKVLTHRNIVEEYEKGSIGVWTDDNGYEWELYFDEDKDFIGVTVDSLDEDQISKLENDCENEKGFYSPLFEDQNIEQYYISYKL